MCWRAGRPGVSGADLANLVNEAALFAVRRGAQLVHAEDFDAWHDRVIIGPRRESMALSEEEKEVGRVPRGRPRRARVRARPLRPGPRGHDPPDRHGARRHRAAPHRGARTSTRRSTSPTRCRRAGGRIAEGIVFGHVSTGAQNDLVRITNGAPHGPRVGHVGAHRADGVGLAGSGVPRRGPRPHPATYSRRDRPRHRRGGRSGSCARRRPGPGGCSGCTGGASTPWPRRCSSTRPSTPTRSPHRRRRDGPQGRRLPQGPQGRRHHHGGQGPHHRDGNRRSKKAAPPSARIRADRD